MGVALSSPVQGRRLRRLPSPAKTMPHAMPRPRHRAMGTMARTLRPGVRMRWRTMALLLLCVLGPSAGMSALAAPDGVSDTSYRTSDGERVMELSTLVPGPVDAVWKAFTTSEGFAKWAAPFARIDLRVGGHYETSYLATATPGAPENIRNEIVALVPLRLVVIRNVQAPPKVPFDTPSFQKTQTAIHFQVVDANTTRVTLHNAGYLDGPGFDATYRHFLAGNAWTLGKLRELFER